MTCLQHYQRKRRPHANYSLEFIFQDVRERLRAKQPIDLIVAPYLSKGVLRRIGIILHAWWCQRGIMHVTGDINFSVLLLDSSRSVLTIHDCGFVERPKSLRSKIVKCFWLDLPVSHMRYITTVSEFSKQEIIRLTGCPAGKITVIPNAISEQFVCVGKTFVEDNPSVLVIGTAKNKNIARIAAALNGIPCQLRIIGHLSKVDQDVLIANSIRFRCDVDLTLEQVVKAYVDSDLLLFPSTYEGFGMPILEAQATGRPVITSDVASMPYVAGDAACLVNPFSVDSIREGVLKVITDASYRDDLVAKGLENVYRFRPDVIVNSYFELYREIESGVNRWS
jgi:glycosyltransferase involved in cell wall biosynthesis